jgi:hypothetical protein
MGIITKTVAGFAAAGAIVLGLAACGSSSGGGGDSSSSSAPKPAAEVDSLTGKSTAVKLDAGFVSALTTLGLTPGVTGTATLADGSVSFPITGGNVKYYTPGTVTPYVQGIINHDGSGLSLTAGATAVTLENFTINPGTSKLYGDVAVNGAVAVKQAYLFNLDGSTRGDVPRRRRPAEQDVQHHRRHRRPRRRHRHHHHQHQVTPAAAR